jgi:hypothetical protein
MISINQSNTVNLALPKSTLPTRKEIPDKMTSFTASTSNKAFVLKLYISLPGQENLGASSKGPQSTLQLDSPASQTLLPEKEERWKRM